MTSTALSPRNQVTASYLSPFVGSSGVRSRSTRSDPPMDASWTAALAFACTLSLRMYMKVRESDRQRQSPTCDCPGMALATVAVAASAMFNDVPFLSAIYAIYLLSGDHTACVMSQAS